MISFGGSLHAGYTGGGELFALDNVTVVTYVPYTPPLIANGGFETASLTGWNLQGNTNSTSVTTTASYVHTGHNYELQFKTNLTQTNWTTLVSFSFSSNYTMSATDTNPPDSAGFYRVVMGPPPLIF